MDPGSLRCEAPPTDWGIAPERWLRAWQARQCHHPNTIRFDRPTETKPVSLTGDRCSLNCAHCGGHYLSHMQPVWEVKADGAKSLLISGGCDPSGAVPVRAHLDKVAKLKESFRLNWHVGFVTENDLAAILPYIDTVSFDIVGDRETAQEVYGLDVGLDDYLRTLDILMEKAPVVPHITIGLRGGELSGERLAIEALAQRQLSHLIFIVLMPTANTRYADRQPPDLAQVADLLLEARLALPNTKLYLGCMRPFGPYRRDLDDIAVRAGINAIVNPSGRAVRVAEELGLEISWGTECCALS